MRPVALALAAVAGTVIWFFAIVGLLTALALL
jgi:hypothetical protein